MAKATTRNTRLAMRPRAKSVARPIKQLAAKHAVMSNELKREAMKAYAEWLFYEHKMLCLELYPNNPPERRWRPDNTAAANFHFPSMDGYTGWQKSPPSSRAMPMMTALGIEVAKHLTRDKRAQRKVDREKAAKAV